MSYSVRYFIHILKKACRPFYEGPFASTQESQERKGVWSCEFMTWDHLMCRNDKSN